MATYAVGDVQGCHASLMALLERVAFQPARDRLWFVGDLVNRGPQSLATLRFVRDLGDRAVTVLGNHDLHLLSVAAGCTHSRDDDTLEEILAAPDRDGLLEWLRHQPLVHQEGPFLMVHAGLLPPWSADDAVRLSAEVQGVLRGPGYAEFLRAMYGNEPRAWSEQLQGMARLRVITNAMTRMRVCSLEGELELKFKGPPERAPKGWVPWFDAPRRRSADVTLITGHWSALGLRLRPDLMALDSGCLWGGALTAVRLEDRAVFQVDCR